MPQQQAKPKAKTTKSMGGPGTTSAGTATSKSKLRLPVPMPAAPSQPQPQQKGSFSLTLPSAAAETASSGQNPTSDPALNTSASTVMSNTSTTPAKGGPASQQFNNISTTNSSTSSQPNFDNLDNASSIAIEQPDEERIQELLTQHFAFVPVEFVDDVVNSINELLYEAMEQLEKYVENKLMLIEESSGKDNPNSLEDTEKAMAEIVTLFENAIDKHFDKFEVYVLNNIFTIPPNTDLTLPQIKDLDFSVTEQQESQLDAEIDMLRKQIAMEKCLQARLKRKIRQRDLRIRSYARMFEFLQSFGGVSAPSSGSGSSSAVAAAAAADANFIAEQVKRIRCLASSTEQRVQSMPSFYDMITSADKRRSFGGGALGGGGNGGGGSGESMIAGTIAKYLEAQRRKQMEEEEEEEEDGEDLDEFQSGDEGVKEGDGVQQQKVKKQKRMKKNQKGGVNPASFVSVTQYLGEYKAAKAIGSVESLQHWISFLEQDGSPETVTA
ncbi:hypothetical protein HK102_000655 [Quaeritorhiza haematococci]|nr:hypothetical protein HK102_000655 [Quaeritorhiza haematococci]